MDAAWGSSSVRLPDSPRRSSAGPAGGGLCGIDSMAALAEVTWVGSAEVRWPGLVTLAVEDAISLAAAFTATALVARIARHTADRTPAPLNGEPIRSQGSGLLLPARTG